MIRITDILFSKLPPEHPDRIVWGQPTQNGIVLRFWNNGEWQLMTGGEIVLETNEILKDLNAAAEEFYTAEELRKAAETLRVSNETSRVSAEELRVTADKAREEAEVLRVEEFNTLKANSETATSAANAAAESAEDTATHPAYCGTDYYWYTWDKETKSYNKTDLYMKPEAFHISVIYKSVAELEADTTEHEDGLFAMVNTGNTQDSENARLYFRSDGAWNFIVDMSGPTSFSGGGQTPQFSIGTVTAGTNMTSATVTASDNGVDDDGNPKYLLNFVLPLLSFDDLTEEQIAALQKPALDEIDKLEETNTKMVAAEEARVTAENSRVEAETNRVSAENTRVENDKAIQEAEAARVTAESGRVTAESSRVTAEEGRVTAESTRDTNEETRKTNETSRASNEESRVTAESSRVQAETDRVEAESTRTTNEESRVTAESSRADAETLRAAAEITRASNETTRQDNEEVRKSNEETRQTNTSTAITNAETATSNANTAAESANTAATTANNLTEEIKAHPPVITDGYWQIWDSTTQSYTTTTCSAVGKSPYINTETNTWMVYNDSTGEYEDSNISINSDYELTKAKVEAVLTGDITTHNHSTQLTEALSGYVAKVDGKDLSSNDFTDELKTKLENIDPDAKSVTNVSELVNDSGYQTASDVNTAISAETTRAKAAEATKQDTLVSGTTIKTVNGNSLLGEGDVTITVPTKTSELTNDSGYLTEHQSLDDYAKTVDVAETYLSKTDAASTYQPVGDYALKSEIPEGAVVDAELSETSTNAVQNKVLTPLINAKANASDLANYVTTTDAAATYLTIENAGTTYQAKGDYLTAETDPVYAADKPNLALKTDLDAYAKSADVTSSLATKQDTLTQGENITISGGVISATDTTYSEATTETSGLMSATDKAKLDAIESGAQVNTVTGVKGDAETDYRTGTINITPANIGLDKVDNTADADKNVLHATSADSATTATSATKATQDNLEQQIDSTYIKDVAISGTTVTLTKGDGTTTTQTTQDTTYTEATTETAGLLSAADKTIINSLQKVATTGSYNDLTDTPAIPEIPTVGTGTLTITQGGETVGTFNANATEDVTMELSGGSSNNVETVTVTVSCDDGTSAEGQEITINGNVYTVDSTGTVVATVPFGLEYTMSMATKSGYLNPTEQTLLASHYYRDVTLIYHAILSGVYIVDTDGAFTAAGNWDSSNNSKAMGISVKTSSCGFIMALEDAASSTKTWGVYGTTYSDVVTTTNTTTARADYKGEANTAALVTQLGADSDYAAPLCAKYTFKNGKTGYLGAAGEMYTVYQNISAINTALTKCGGTTISTTTSGNYYYWTSTQYDSGYSWIQSFSGGGTYDRKPSSYYVRALCAF